MDKIGLGGLSMAGMIMATIEGQLAYAIQIVNRNSNSSDLEFSDL